jgi:molybdate transport system regulatory protein
MKTEVKPKKWDRINLLYSILLTTVDGKTIINDQRLALLMAINEYGSIRKAAEVLKISYRKAMYDLKETHKILGSPLIEKQSGGKNGGYAILTEDGKILVEAYKVFCVQFQEAVNDIIKNFKKTLKHN